MFPATVVALLNTKKPPFFTLECLTALFPCQLRYAVKLQSKKPPGSLLLVDTMLWMEVYWTGRDAECSMLLTLDDQDRVISTNGRYSHNADQTNVEIAKVIKTLMRRAMEETKQIPKKTAKIQAISTNKELLQFSIIINTCMSY